jgi:Ca-activated chloride channel homolog
MNWVSPSVLWWLAPFGALVLVLYMLRMRRRDMVVPATFLWPELTSEVRANTFFQKLRWNPLMVLQLLAGALLIAMVARPQLQQRGLSGKVTILVIDASASMRAQDGSPTRFDDAKAAALNVVQGIRPGDQVSVIAASVLPRVVCPKSGDIVRLRRAINELAPTDASSDMGEALRLAASIVGKGESARIVVLSDGVFPRVENLSLGNAELVYAKFGKSRKNYSISALGCAETPSGVQAFVGVRNHSLDSARLSVQVQADGKLINSFEIEVPSNQTSGKVVAVPAGAESVQAKLVTSDILPADNVATALAGRSGQVKTLIVGPTDFFLERALSLDPRVVLDRSDAVPASAEQGQYNLVIFNGVPETAVKADGVIAIAALSNSSKKLPPLGEAAKHPVLDGFDFGTTYVDSAQAGLPGKRLLGTPETPLISVEESPKRKVNIAFKLGDSDFPLQVGFPIFVANCVDWLAGSESSRGPLVVRAGAPFSVSTDAATVNLSRVSDGENFSLEGTGDRVLVRETTQVGEYKLADRSIFVNFGDASESQIEPQDSLSVGGQTAKATETIFRLADVWRWAACALLILLAGEWWLFVRKS